MTNLPNCSGVRIDSRKITHYLPNPNPNHRTGGPKSAFFFARGFGSTMRGSWRMPFASMPMIAMS
jgi:hypothetical protein